MLREQTPCLMSEQYYYASNGQRKGPIDFADLRELAVKAELKRDAKVWWKGMQEWQPAGAVSGLFEDLPPDLELQESAAGVKDSEVKVALAPVAKDSPASALAATFSLVAIANKGIDKLNTFLAPPEPSESGTTPVQSSAPVIAEAGGSLTGAGEGAGTVFDPAEVNPSPEVKKCGYCGRENVPDAINCTECGQTEFMVVASASSNVPPPPAPRTHGKDREVRWPTGALAWTTAFVLCLVLVTGGAYLVHRYRVGLMMVEAAALKSKMNDNFHNGLAGMTWNEEAGVILLSSTKDMENMKQSWSIALQQWRQIDALESKIEMAGLEFPINRLWWKIKGFALGSNATPEARTTMMRVKHTIHGDMEGSLDLIRRLDNNRGTKLALDEIETAAIANFMRSAILFTPGAEEPFHVKWVHL